MCFLKHLHQQKDSDSREYIEYEIGKIDFQDTDQNGKIPVICRVQRGKFKTFDSWFL